MSDPDVEWLILDTDNYEDKINHIGISHERSKKRAESLTDGEQSILRSELCELVWISRIARPGAMCDSSPSAQTFTAREIGDSKKGSVALSNSQEEEKAESKIISDFERMPVYHGFLSRKSIAGA